MSEEERERLMKLGDQVFARWQELENSGSISKINYINVPRAQVQEQDSLNAQEQEILRILFSMQKFKEDLDDES